MQDRYTMFRRGPVFYAEDRTTGQQKSLKTRDESEARRMPQLLAQGIPRPDRLLLEESFLVWPKVEF